MQEKIVIIDFGSTDTQLIARKVRNQQVFCEIFPFNKPIKNLHGIKGIILSDLSKLIDSSSLQIDLANYPANFPILGIGYGAEILANHPADKKLKLSAEALQTAEGDQVITDFLDLCNCKKDWTPASFIEQTIAELKQTIGNDKVVLGLSGGVDSSVLAVLLHKAIGKQLTCIFVDHGLLRKQEFETVLKDYEHLGLQVIGVDAKAYFYKKLQGVQDPEQKRKIIGAAFIDIFDQEAGKIEDVKWLAQGTIYPDIIESVTVGGGGIKSHHNVGGLPEKMQLKLCEPLRALFKDEVRKVGIELGMMSHLIDRHPFPGPGLAVRILGDITAEKVHILQEADHIYILALKKWDLYNKVWQAGAILLPVQSVGVKEGQRTYENAVALRAVLSVDAMSADWAKLPYEFLAEVSNQIIQQVEGVNRVVYDISAKPPATIEWE